MFRKALAIDPELTAPRLGLSNLFSELGDFEKAEAEAEIALSSHPKLIEVYYQYATHRKGKVSDHELEIMTALLGEKHMGDGARSQLNFALVPSMTIARIMSCRDAVSRSPTIRSPRRN